jgi:hypothetical protein
MAVVAGKLLSVTFGGTAARVTSSSASRDIGEVDVTSTLSSGNHEFITDISSTTVEFTVVVDSAAAPNYAPGTTGSVVWAVTGGRSVSGAATILRATHTAGPRGAYTIAASAKISGAVTEV